MCMWGEVDLSAGACTQGGKRHQIPMELVTGSHKPQDVGAWNQTLLRVHCGLCPDPITSFTLFP